jgi:thioredoxin reductase (NADPH)
MSWWIVMAGDGVAGPPEPGAASLGGPSSAPDVPDVRLTSEQIDLLRREGQVRPTVAGEVEDTATKAFETLPAAALIILVGAKPHTQWLAGSVLVDDGGYVVTGPGLGPDTRHRSPWTGRDHDPYLLETSAPGVFAAGDVRSGSVKRAAAAVGEGSIAVRFVSEHLGRRAGFATSFQPSTPPRNVPG